MPAHKRQQRLRAGLLAGEARDGIRDLAAGLAPDLPLPLDAAHLGHARPIEMGHNLTARGDAARLEAPVPLLDGAGLLKVRRRAVPEGITGGLLISSASGAICTWPITAPSWLAKAATTCTPSLPSCPAGALPRRRLPSIATVPSSPDPCAQTPNACSVAATSRAL